MFAVIRRNSFLIIHVARTAGNSTGLLGGEVHNGQSAALVDLDSAHLVLRRAVIRVVVAGLHGLAIEVDGDIGILIDNKHTLAVFVAYLLVITGSLSGLSAHSDIILHSLVNQEAVFQFVLRIAVEVCIGIAAVKRGVRLRPKPCEIMGCLFTANPIASQFLFNLCYSCG